jgi:hypothetical protein
MLSKARLALAALLVVSAASVACAAQSSDPSPTPSSSGTSETDKSLTVNVGTDGTIDGTFTHDTDTLTFQLGVVSKDVYSVTVKTRGLTLDATVDRTAGASSFDGFGSASGGDTQLTKEDQPVLIAFAKAIGTRLDPQVKAKDPSAETMTRLATIWSEWPSTMTLSKRVVGEEGRSWTTICQYLGQVYDTTHDCCTHWYDPCTEHDDWSTNSSVHSYIGDYGNSSTMVWDGSYWGGEGVDHRYWPYEYGDCFARCGADCGSGHQYTVDCGNHDNCVRNGHWIGSAYCDDEFAATLDDAAFAPDCY